MDEIEEYEELFKRYEAATKLGIRPYTDFDSAPASELERLLLLSTELELAKAEKIKRANT